MWYLWSNLIQSILSELLNSSLFWKGFLISFHLICSVLFLGERLYTCRNSNSSAFFIEFCLRTGHFPLSVNIHKISILSGIKTIINVSNVYWINIKSEKYKFLSCNSTLKKEKTIISNINKY